VREFDEVKAYGKSDSTVRTADQTATAYFYTANVIRQFNGDRRADGLAAAPADAQPPRVPVSARNDHVRDGGGIQRVPRH